jgi:ribose-phosphate pyrophosphokinase
MVIILYLTTFTPNGILSANKTKEKIIMTKKIALIAGSTHPLLAEAISIDFGIPLTKRIIEQFANGEINVELQESVSGAEVFIIESSITGKVNDNFIESLLLIDAAKRAKAEKVYLVQTMFPYQRQDRRETNKKNRPKRKSISSKVMVNCLQKAVGVHGVIVVKLHADQIEGFFDNDTICENIDPLKLFIDYLKEEGVINGHYPEKAPVVVAPDVGSAKTADVFSEMIGLEYVIMNKRRPKNNESEVLHIIGDYSDRDCIIYDDMIDTGGTVINGLLKLKQQAQEKGAKRVYLMATHGVFSKNAVQKLAEAGFEKIIVTDSIPNPELAKYPEKFHVIELAPILSKIIRNTHDQESLQPVVYEPVSMQQS